jgi:flagellar basal-body rod modification protein FlgD
VSGAVELPQAASEVTLYVEDAAGQIVRQIDLGGHAAGQVPFIWEGMADLGGVLSPGTYRLKAQAIFDESGPQALNTLVRLNVESVTIPGNGEAPLLNLSDRRQVSLSDVREVM